MRGRLNAARSWAAMAHVARLPRGARWLAVALLASASIPAAAALLAARGGSALAVVLGKHAGAVQAMAALLAVLAVVAFEPPRSASPLAYARQLRARLLAIQSTFDADDRRDPREGKEKEDERSPSEA